MSTAPLLDKVAPVYTVAAERTAPVERFFLISMPKPTANLNMVSLVTEMGFIISLPLLVLVFIGIKIDRYFHTSPICLLIGIITAAIISSLAIGKKIKQLNQTIS